MEAETVQATVAESGQTTVPPSRRRWRRFAATTVAGGVLLSGACTSDPKAPSWQGGTGGPSAQAPAQAQTDPNAPAVTITSPAMNATAVLASTDIVFTKRNAANVSVVVTDAAGAPVKGALVAGDESWRPDRALQYGTTYTATVTATGNDGKTGTTTSTFTTMAKPRNLVRVSSFLGDGQTVGVGMPLIVRFGREVPVKYRADVQRRMTVRATPSQKGIWHWISATEVRYRPRSYWKANSKVAYKVRLAGVPMGDNWYGRSDLTVDINIGRAFMMTVENKTKKMTVRQDGRVIKTIPVSLGKKSTPSSSGTMVIIEKKRHTVFDTREELGPKEGYRTEIDFAQRITWSGQFIHAAKWSEHVQGRLNVSHGCVNVSEKMGEWLFARTMIGDPITVKGTEEKLRKGNGWTDWNMSWSEYVRGSAIPADE